MLNIETLRVTLMNAWVLMHYFSFRFEIISFILIVPFGGIKVIWTPPDCVRRLSLVKAPTLLSSTLSVWLTKAQKHIQWPWWSTEVDGGCIFSDLRSLASVSEESPQSRACCWLIHMSAYRPPLASSSSCLGGREGVSLQAQRDREGESGNISHSPSSLGDPAVPDNQNLVCCDYSGQPWTKKKGLTQPFETN